MNWVKNWLAHSVLFQAAGEEQRVQWFRSYGPLSQRMQKQSGLCATASVRATKSLTVQCQPTDSALHTHRPELWCFFQFLACKWEDPSCFSVKFSFLLTFYAMKRGVQKLLQLTFDLNWLVLNVAVNWAEDTYIRALTVVSFNFVWKTEGVAIPCSDFEPIDLAWFQKRSRYLIDIVWFGENNKFSNLCCWLC